MGVIIHISHLIIYFAFSLTLASSYYKDGMIAVFSVFIILAIILEHSKQLL